MTHRTEENVTERVARTDEELAAKLRHLLQEAAEVATELGRRDYDLKTEMHISDAGKVSYRLMVHKMVYL